MRRETNRLWLEPFAMDQTEDLHRLNSDPEVMHFLGGPETLAQTKSGIKRVQSRWDALGYSWWSLIEKDTGSLVGSACLQNIENVPGAELEIGWRLLPEAQGKGYATEAGQAAIDFAFEVIAIDHIIATADPRNTPSLNVMERLGLTYRGVERYYDVDCATYVMVNPLGQT